MCLRQKVTPNKFCYYHQHNLVQDSKRFLIIIYITELQTYFSITDLFSPYSLYCNYQKKILCSPLSIFNPSSTSLLATRQKHHFSTMLQQTWLISTPLNLHSNFQSSLKIIFVTLSTAVYRTFKLLKCHSHVF